MSIIDELTNLELKILPIFVSHDKGEGVTLDAAMSLSGLKDIEVLRSSQWLSNKGLVKVAEDAKEFVDLDSNGKSYRDSGLPEVRILHAIKNTKKSVSQLASEGITNDEINISVGQLKKNVAINLSKNENNELVLEITENGKKLLDKESLETRFLKKKFPVLLSELAPEEKFAYDTLVRRKQIVKTEIKKTITVFITPEGKEIEKNLKSSGNAEKIERLTPEMIRSGGFQGKYFRSFDIKSPVPKYYYGRKHFVNEAIDYIKKIFLEMGFAEMKGSMVQTSFWDLDSLFVPQDHPAREMQDTFYIKNPAEGELQKTLSGKIKAVHEKGLSGLDKSGINAIEGSRGWGGKFSEEVSRKNLLRTHNTVISAQTIAQLKETDLPAKFFSIDKVYRNEALDQKHLFEFHQVEGIVVDPNANFKHLLGYLKEFFKKMGYDDVRIRPAHFPYTEPSAEIEVYIKETDTWIELGGSGIFRPEVVVPLLGKDVPVLAWGLGLERIIVPYFGFRDIRLLYNNDLKVLRNSKKWMM